MILLFMINYRTKHSTDEWQTPSYVYDELNKEFNFDFDPCPIERKWDALKINWGKRNFVNPPYNWKQKEAFIKKAIEESKKGKLCVMLLPVSTSTKLFHDVIVPNAKEIRFIKRRIKFIRKNKRGKMDIKSPMFDSMIVVLKSKKRN